MIILIASRLEMFHSQEYYKTTTSEECASNDSFIGRASISSIHAINPSDGKSRVSNVRT